MNMTMDHSHSNGMAARMTMSPALSELLSVISTTTNPSKKDSSSLDHLVAFRKKAQPPLSSKDVTIAFRTCFQNFHPHTLSDKVFVVDWLSDLVKTSSDAKAPTAVILELSKVSVQLNLNRQETEEWMPLLTSLCALTNSCLGAVRRLTRPALTAFLTDQAFMTLTSIILDTGVRVFRHIDRSQVKRERSDGYMTWSQMTLNLTKNFQEFVGDQVQQNIELRAHAGNATIHICNMLLRYAEEARSEYAYLNFALKCIVSLIPNCEENAAIRLDTQSAIRLLCDGIVNSFLDIYRTCAQSFEVNSTYITRRWTLARFYIAHLRTIAGSLFKDICGSGNEAMTSRGQVRYLLFFMRGRFISCDVIKKNHPDIQSEIVKFVGAVEEVLVSALFGSKGASDDNKRALVHEFAMASEPRAAFDSAEPMSEYEWDVGRLKFLLKTLSIFDELSPVLQLQLYPAQGTSSQGSLLDRIIDCVNAIGLREFVPMAFGGAGQENSDLYFRLLSELCTFACLAQPKQFTRLQVNMVGLVLGRSEIWSLIARDWWICMSEKLGQVFTTNQILVLIELLISLPLGRTSRRVGTLIGSMLLLLNDQSQSLVITKLMVMFDRKPDRIMYSLLSCFPFECLNTTNLDLLVDRCTDGWRTACGLLSNERLVIEALYTMHQYAACLAAVFSKRERRNALPEDTRQSLVGWSLEILGGAHELLTLIKDDRKALLKISRTIEDIVAFIRSMQPLPCSELIPVLEAIASWESFPLEMRPLPRLSIALFLGSCAPVAVEDDASMAKMKGLLRTLYHNLLSDAEWVVVHASLVNLAIFSNEARCPQVLGGCVPDTLRDYVSKLMEMERSDKDCLADETQPFWEALESRTIGLRSRGFSASTLSDMMMTLGTPPSSQACIAALAGVAQYLEGMDNAARDHAEFKNRLNSELARVQKLAQSYEGFGMIEKQ
ncbi:hypothetical protein EDD21DRAFT_384924 [Dissophora ornata]|nr:hypothetical protein EDD21DRAFT_384924 [Dissophora ornata]